MEWAMTGLTEEHDQLFMSDEGQKVIEVDHGP